MHTEKNHPKVNNITQNLKKQEFLPWKQGLKSQCRRELGFCKMFCLAVLLLVLDTSTEGGAWNVVPSSSSLPCWPQPWFVNYKVTGLFGFPGKCKSLLYNALFVRKNFSIFPSPSLLIILSLSLSLMNWWTYYVVRTTYVCKNVMDLLF